MFFRGGGSTWRRNGSFTLQGTDHPDQGKQRMKLRGWTRAPIWRRSRIAGNYSAVGPEAQPSPAQPSLPAGTGARPDRLTVRHLCLRPLQRRSVPSWGISRSGSKRQRAFYLGVDGVLRQPDRAGSQEKADEQGRSSGQHQYERGYSDCARAARHRHPNGYDTQNQDRDSGEYGKYRVLQQSVTVKEHGKLEVDLRQSLPGTRRQVAHREQAPRFTRQDVHAFAVHRAHSVIDRSVQRKDTSRQNSRRRDKYHGRHHGLNRSDGDRVHGTRQTGLGRNEGRTVRGAAGDHTNRR